MIKAYTGIETDVVVIGLLAAVLILLVLLIVLTVKQNKLKARLDLFMKGKKAEDLEDTLIGRLDQVDRLEEENRENKLSIESINKRMRSTFQKYSLLKYDAFDESGGKLSFVLVMLDEKNDGWILNVVHGREGSYAYTKEIIDGNSIVQLGAEEEKALEDALEAERQDREKEEKA